MNEPILFSQWLVNNRPAVRLHFEQSNWVVLVDQLILRIFRVGRCGGKTFFLQLLSDYLRDIASGGANHE